MPTNHDVYKDQAGDQCRGDVALIFSLQLGVELNETRWNSSLLSLFKRISFQSRKLDRSAETDPMPKNRLDSSEICSRIYAIPWFRHWKSWEMLMHVQHRPIRSEGIILWVSLVWYQDQYQRRFMSIFLPMMIWRSISSYMKTMKHDSNDENYQAHDLYGLYSIGTSLPQLLRRRSIKVLIISRFDDHHANHDRFLISTVMWSGVRVHKDTDNFLSR